MIDILIGLPIIILIVCLLWNSSKNYIDEEYLKPKITPREAEQLSINKPIHDDIACKALLEYERNARSFDTSDGRPIKLPKAFTMQAVADKYNTTCDEMKKHWKCRKTPL